MTVKHVLSVGQCFADHSAISRAIRQHFDAEVVGAATQAEALEKLRHQPFALVLVNRVLDADRSSGLNLITRLKEEEDLRNIPVMLVSNYEDSQRDAVAKGALPGFGKAELGQPWTVERLKAVLGEEAGRSPG
jgi:two-component system chemotaxis response regulator CheY